jgi:hypothetical protein
MAAAAAAVLAMGGVAYAQATGDNNPGTAPGDHAAPKAERAAGHQDSGPAQNGPRSEATGNPRGLQNTGMNGGGDSRMNERTDDRSNTRDMNGMAGDRDRNGGMTGADRMRTHTTRITDVQKTKIKEVFRGRPGPRLTHVTFRIGVGARIPRTVRIVAVPPEIVAIAPEWQGYSYFQTADEIVIVDPMSFGIVGVLPL